MNEPAPTTAKPDETLHRLAMLCVLYGLVAFVSFRPFTGSDADLWWHLSTGRWIVENGRLPTTDPFSAWGQDKPWAAYSWLFELLLYGLYAWFGLFGILLYRFAMMLLIVAALHYFIAKHVPRFLPMLLLLGAGFLTLLPLVSDRPWFFSILFTLWTLDVVLDLRAGRTSWTHWLLPLGYVAWANTHIQFLYGLAVLGVACVAPLLDRWASGPYERAGDVDGKPDRLHGPLAALTAACLLATLVNPFHVRLYTIMVDYATQKGSYSYITELQALSFRDVSDWAILGLFAAAMFALGRRGRWSCFELLLLAGTAYVSFRTKRDSWYVVLASLGVICTSGAVKGEADRLDFTWPRAGIIGLAVLLAAIGTCWLRDLSEQRLEAAVAEKFPAAACDYLHTTRLEGRVYNHYNWGGYLIWRLHPQLKVTIDSRSNLHGDERIERVLAVWAGSLDWTRDPELMKEAKVVIVDRGSALAQILEHDPRLKFKRVYPQGNTGIALVFVRQ